MLDPEQQWLFYWDFLTASYHVLEEHKEELKAAKQARKRFPANLQSLSLEIRALAALGRIDEVKRLNEESFSFSKESGLTPGDIMRNSAEELRAHGYGDAAITILDQAVQWYKGRPAEEMDSLGYGLTLYDARRWEEAKSIFEQLAKGSPDRFDYHAILGCITARQGDREKALKVSEWLKNLKRPYLFGEHIWCRAYLMAVLGEKDQAVSLLKESFLQGFQYNISLHTDVDFESLWDYPPFKKLLKPKG
jgi:tetratricopeptide (TPR) repeat protein